MAGENICEDVCRLCLTENTIINIFSQKGVLLMIQRYCPIEIMENDGYPQRICTDCFRNLKTCENFINKCIESDHKLKLKTEVTITEGTIKLEEEDYMELNLTPDDGHFDNDDFHQLNDDVNSEETYHKIKSKESVLPQEKFVLTQKTKDRLSKIISEKFKAFKCDLCTETVNTRKNLEHHLKVIHSIGEFPCRKCKIVFETKYDLQVHNCNPPQVLFKQLESQKSNEESARDVESEDDFFDLDKKYQLCRAKKKNSVEDNTKLCDICGEKRWDIANHIKQHLNDKSYKCKLCSKGFKTSGALGSHMRGVHSNKRFTCDICKNTFNSIGILKTHLKNVHSTLKIKCSLCSKIFKRQYNLNLHMLTHTLEKKFDCRYCDSKFSVSGTRLDHERLHLGITPYKCPSCPKEFTQLSNMKSHFKYNHKDIVFRDVYKPRNYKLKSVPIKSLESTAEKTAERTAESVSNET